MNGLKITKFKEVNFLGVILDVFDESLSWKPHISQAASKISKYVLGVIRNSSFCVTKTVLCTYLILFELDTRVITVNL